MLKVAIITFHRAINFGAALQLSAKEMKEAIEEKED